MQKDQITHTRFKIASKTMTHAHVSCKFASWYVLTNCLIQFFILSHKCSTTTIFLPNESQQKVNVKQSRAEDEKCSRLVSM